MSAGEREREDESQSLPAVLVAVLEAEWPPLCYSQSSSGRFDGNSVLQLRVCPSSVFLPKVAKKAILEKKWKYQPEDRMAKWSFFTEDEVKIRSMTDRH